MNKGTSSKTNLGIFESLKHLIKTVNIQILHVKKEYGECLKIFMIIIIIIIIIVIIVIIT
jgi:hypothetical protein